MKSRWMSVLWTSLLAVSLAGCDGGSEPSGDGDVGDGDGDSGDGDTGDGDGDELSPYVSDFVVGGLGESAETDSPKWRGYMFTAAGTNSTISPEEFLGQEICASGQLGANYEEWALVGWNIAQEIDEETLDGGAVNAISPGGSGVAYDIVNLGTSGLRIQIQADDMGVERWCAKVPSTNPGVIPWEDFRKECWNTEGAAYDPSTPLAQIGVQTFAASETLPTEFNYCVIHLGPAP